MISVTAECQVKFSELLLQYNPLHSVGLTGPKPQGIKAETFRIDYLARTTKVEKFSLQPVSRAV